MGAAVEDYSDPELDGALIATIHHECILMKASFDRFAELGEKQITVGLDKKEQVSLFTSYLNFLHHLYEVYIACFKREQGSDVGFSGPRSNIKRDQLLLGETRRVFFAIESGIRNGTAESWRNHISCYQGEIPMEFVTQFRTLRNQIAHALPNRVAGEIDLTDFYLKYHKYVYELYRSISRYWGRFEIENLDLKAIERFSVNIWKT